MKQDRNQWFSALEAANRTRCEHAEIKRELASGEKDPTEWLETPLEQWPKALCSLQTTHYLESVPRIAHVKCGQIMRRVHIANPKKRMGDLTEHQRRGLASELSRSQKA